MKATKQNILRFSCLCLWVFCVLVESAFEKGAAYRKTFYTALGIMVFSSRQVEVKNNNIVMLRPRNPKAP